MKRKFTALTIGNCINSGSDSIHSVQKLPRTKEGLIQICEWVYISFQEHDFNNWKSRNYQEASSHIVVTAIFGPRYMSQKALFDWLKRGVWRGWGTRRMKTSRKIPFLNFSSNEDILGSLNTSRLLLHRVTRGAPNDNFRKNICSEDDLRSRIFGTFVVKFLACLPLLGFSNI